MTNKEIIRWLRKNIKGGLETKRSVVSGHRLIKVKNRWIEVEQKLIDQVLKEIKRDMKKLKKLR